MRLEKDKHYLFGHRGYAKDAVENTIPSFLLCIERGIPGVELDVHLTRDGKLVVAHDFSLLRTALVDKKIEELDYKELEEYNVGAYKGGNGRIPLLSEVFATCGKKLYYDIEIKDNGIKDIGLEKALWKEIAASGMTDYCVVSSFNPVALRRFRHVSKRHIDTGLIFFTDKTVPKILWHGGGRLLSGCTFLKPGIHEVTGKLLRKFKRRYPIIPWTVDDKETAQTMHAIGVSGVISNDPSVALDEFGKQ